MKPLDRQLLDRINAAATCGMLAASSGRLIGVGVKTLWAGGGGVVPLTLGSLGLLASMYACGESEAGGQNPSNRSGCQLTPNGGAVMVAHDEGVAGAGFVGFVWTEIVDIQERESSYGDEYLEYRVTARNIDGTESVANPEWQLRTKGSTFFMKPQEGDECARDMDDGLPLPPEATQPIPYTDPETNCTYNITLQGFGESFPGGPQSPVWLIEAAGSERADGSRIGGCNFQPTIYYDDSGGGGGGPTVPPIPVPPGPGPIDWTQILANGLAGAIGRILYDAFAALLAPKMPPASFEFVAPCDKNADGTNSSVVYALPEQSYQSRVVSQQAVLMEIMQQHLNWKTPTCNATTTKGAYARSLSFISEADPANNYQRCHKRFGYRSDSPGDLQQLFAHWRDFVWDTGPVIVGHSGSALGSPQVWAASVDEGKRVIQHAGAEAGVDPDQVGQWSIGSSNHPRYGLSHRVRLKDVDGTWACTARVGPSDWPLSP